MAAGNMSTVGLPDDVYQRLKEQAGKEGVSPAEWIEAKVAGGRTVATDEEGAPLSKALAGYIGVIDTLENPVTAKDRTALGDMVAEDLAKQGIRPPWQR
jgi:hypothetical protein